MCARCGKPSYRFDPDFCGGCLVGMSAESNANELDNDDYKQILISANVKRMWAAQAVAFFWFLQECGVIS